MKKKLVMTGVGLKGEKFKINTAPPKIEPHLIHNGTGIPSCSSCGKPVNIQEGGCKICDNCFSKF